jgi:hypothetical protein
MTGFTNWYHYPNNLVSFTEQNPKQGVSGEACTPSPLSGRKDGIYAATRCAFHKTKAFHRMRNGMYTRNAG